MQPDNFWVEASSNQFNTFRSQNEMLIVRGSNLPINSTTAALGCPCLQNAAARASQEPAAFIPSGRGTSAAAARGSATPALCCPCQALGAQGRCSQQPLPQGRERVPTTKRPRGSPGARHPVHLLRCLAGGQQHPEHPLAVFLQCRGSRRVGDPPGIGTQQSHPTSGLRGRSCNEPPAAWG